MNNLKLNHYKRKVGSMEQKILKKKNKYVIFMLFNLVLIRGIINGIFVGMDVVFPYIADCSNMKPVGPNEVGYLVNMTKSFVEAGCKAFGFAEGRSVMLKIQAKKNTEMSNTGVLEGHFETVQEALDWFKEAVNI